MRSTNKAFYNSKIWKDTRKAVLRRDLYTCADCYGRASEVHHIKELTDADINNYDIALNPNNLMCLCKSCHTKRTNGNEGDVNDEYYFDENGFVIQRTPHNEK